MLNCTTKRGISWQTMPSACARLDTHTKEASSFPLEALSSSHLVLIVGFLGRMSSSSFFFQSKLNLLDRLRCKRSPVRMIIASSLDETRVSIHVKQNRNNDARSRHRARSLSPAIYIVGRNVAQYARAPHEKKLSNDIRAHRRLHAMFQST